MQFYRHKEDGTIRRYVRPKDKENFELIRGETNIEFNLMEIEQHLDAIRSRLGWILGIIIILIIFSILGAILGVAGTAALL